MRKDWLWDRDVSKRQAARILDNPAHPQFISLSSLLLARKNNPREVFQQYLKPEEFFRHWTEIKRKMKKDAWNNPRIEFWQAVYEKLSEKYRARGIKIFLREKVKPVNEFCIWVGERIRSLRKEKRLTQKMLAERLNISQQMISRIESGRENTSLLTLKKIIDELGAKISIEGKFSHLGKEILKKETAVETGIRIPF